MVLESLPFGGDNDETLQQPDISPEDWLKTASMQALLLAEGDPSPPAAPAAAEHSAAATAAALPKAPAKEADAEDNLGISRFILLVLFDTC